MTSLVVLGGGRMGSALLGGLVRNGFVEPGDCVVVERRPEARADIEHRFPAVKTAEDPVDGDAAILAVKPGDAEGLCRALHPRSYRRVLSIVAGVSTAQIESWLWSGVSVMRAMPNTPSLVGAGASAVAGGKGASEKDLEWAEGVLSAVGVVVRLPESSFDAVTGLSGSGPAYVFMIAEALIEAGVLNGLPRDVSRLLTIQTLLGSAHMLDETDDSPEDLRSAVTSPGGTTAAGLRVLESHRLRYAFLDAVTAAAERATSLGRDK